MRGPRRRPSATRTAPARPAGCATTAADRPSRRSPRPRTRASATPVWRGSPARPVRSERRSAIPDPHVYGGSSARMRLVKFLANAGVASRRAAEPLIAAGRVTVNDELVTDPARDVSAADRILVDGARATLPDAGGVAVYAVNKPAGVVSTASDPQGR